MGSLQVLQLPSTVQKQAKQEFSQLIGHSRLIIDVIINVSVIGCLSLPKDAEIGFSPKTPDGISSRRWMDGVRILLKENECLGISDYLLI